MRCHFRCSLLLPARWLSSSTSARSFSITACQSTFTCGKVRIEGSHSPDSYLAVVLGELLVSLLSAKVLQEFLSICEHSIHMNLVLCSQIEGSVPAKRIDVHFNGAMDEWWRSLQENAFSLVDLAPKESHLSLTAFFRWYLLDVLNIFHLRAH